MQERPLYSEMYGSTPQSLLLHPTHSHFTIVHSPSPTRNRFSTPPLACTRNSKEGAIPLFELLIDLALVRRCRGGRSGRLRHSHVEELLQLLAIE